jgi:hypothetical protein
MFMHAKSHDDSVKHDTPTRGIRYLQRIPTTKRESRDFSNDDGALLKIVSCVLVRVCGVVIATRGCDTELSDTGISALLLACTCIEAFSLDLEIASIDNQSQMSRSTCSARTAVN